MGRGRQVAVGCVHEGQRNHGHACARVSPRADGCGCVCESSIRTVYSHTGVWLLEAGVRGFQGVPVSVDVCVACVTHTCAGGTEEDRSHGLHTLPKMKTTSSDPNAKCRRFPPRPLPK